MSATQSEGKSNLHGAFSTREAFNDRAARVIGVVLACCQHPNELPAQRLQLSDALIDDLKFCSGELLCLAA
jgi:hypothetical protein